MKKMGIYAITHTDSGRVYIGSTSNIASRFRDHRRFLRIGQHPNAYLQRSWNRHGAQAFTFEVVEEVIEISRLLEREQFHIDARRAANHANGFNLSPTAGSARGCVRSPETRALLSKLHLGRRHTPEARAKISQAQIGKRRSPEQRRRMAAAQQRPEQRAKISATQKAHAQTPAGQAQRQRLVALNRARPMSPEQRESIRARVTGTKASDSAREAMRSASRKFWDSPAGKARAAAHSQWVRDHRAKKATA